MNNTPQLVKLLNIAHDESALLTEKRKAATNQAYFKEKLSELKTERQGILAVLKKQLSKLTPIERNVFYLRFIKGKSVRRIAKEMYYSTSTIHHKISKICEKLTV